MFGSVFFSPQGSSLTEGNRGKRSKRSGPGSGGAAGATGATGAVPGAAQPNGNHDAHSESDAKNVGYITFLII